MLITTRDPRILTERARATRLLSPDDLILIVGFEGQIEFEKHNNLQLILI